MSKRKLTRDAYVRQLPEPWYNRAILAVLDGLMRAVPVVRVIGMVLVALACLYTLVVVLAWGFPR